MKILFWLNLSKKNKQNEYPLYCRITINKKRAEISTGIFLKKTDFDNKKKQVKKTHPLADAYNQYIFELSAKLNKLYFNLISEGNEPSARQIRELYRGERKRKTKTVLLDVVKEYITDKYSIDNNENVFKANERLLAVIESALKEFNKTSINIDSCDYEFYNRLAYYLRNNQKYSAKYIKRIVGLMNASIRYANQKGYSNRLPVDYKVAFKDEHNIIYLTEQELEKLKKHRFLEPRLQRAADCFIFQCYTGLDYSTLKKFNANYLVNEQNKLWIKINREKVKTAKSIIPVFKVVKDLLIKYNFKMPVPSLNKYNKALREIANEIGIHKKITSHVGRKTFATILLNKDVPIETVSRLLSHSSIKVTQSHYAEITQMKVSNDLRGLM